MGEDLAEKLVDAERAHRSQQHSLGWNLINEVTGRKSSATGKLKRNTENERRKGWYNHFSSLLGEGPNIEDEDEEIEAVLLDIAIDDGPFTREEYHRAEGKDSGEDSSHAGALKKR